MNMPGILFLGAEKWKQPICPSVDEWTHEMWSLCAMDDYLAMKRNESLIQATAWKSLGNLMLRERRQMQKATCCVIPCL